MKKRRETNELNSSRWFVVLPVFLILTFQVAAQDEVDGDSAKPPENEIVCFAAKKKWVCAPADERQKAHDKAMKMLVDNEVEEVELPLDNGVEIQTMPFNEEIKPASEQATSSGTVSQSVIAEQIKDFTPREVVSEEIVEEPVVEPVKELTEVSEEPVPNSNNAEKPGVIQAEPTTEVSEEPVSPDNDFSNWLSSYPERWSFQVIGTSNRHHLDDFIQSNGLSGIPHAIVKTQANGADWWVVMAGLYETRDDAINRRQELPAHLASNAWVRQIKAITGVAD